MNPDVSSLQGINTISVNAGGVTDGQSAQGLSSLLESQQKLVTKNLLDLVSGDRFTAVVRDVKPGMVWLALADGSVLEAKTLAIPDAHIGDEAVFRVKENMRGQLLLELVKPANAVGGVSAGVVRDALAAAGMAVTDESVRLVNGLIRHNAPIHADALRNAAFFTFAAPDLTEAQAAFLVKENLPPTEKTIETFRAFADGTRRLDAQVAGLAKQIADAEPALRQRLTDLLRPGEALPAKDAADVVNRFFRLQLGKEAAAQAEKPLAAYFEKTAGAVEQLKAALPPNHPIAAALDGLADSLRFMNGIHAGKQYMQIPYQHESRDGQGALHVMARRGRATGVMSALLALDYQHLQHVEAFIQKSGERVVLQFRAESGDALRLLTAHMPELTEALAASGYSVASVGYKKTDERFALEAALTEDDGEKPVANRYSFDMRV